MSTGDPERNWFSQALRDGDGLMIDDRIIVRRGAGFELWPGGPILQYRAEAGMRGDRYRVTVNLPRTMKIRFVNKHTTISAPIADQPGHGHGP